jgi:hypothetical protein
MLVEDLDPKSDRANSLVTLGFGERPGLDRIVRQCGPSFIEESSFQIDLGLAYVVVSQDWIIVFEDDPQLRRAWQFMLESDDE